MKLILEHLKKNREVLLNYYNLIGIAEHKTILGTAREALISGFLEQNLPEFISYHSGEMFDCESNRSGQIDIILHPITSPKLNLYGTINMFPVETVLAAIEIKSVLNNSTLNQALHNCFMAKSLDRQTQHTGAGNYRNTFKTPYILFVFHGPNMTTLLKNMETYYTKNKKELKHPGFLPDLIVVLNYGKSNKSYCLNKNVSWMNAGLLFEQLYSNTYNDDDVLVGPFQFILRKAEYWFARPEFKMMPLKKYIEDPPPSLDDFFK